MYPLNVSTPVFVLANTNDLVTAPLTVNILEYVSREDTNRGVVSPDKDKVPSLQSPEVKTPILFPTNDRTPAGARHKAESLEAMPDGDMLPRLVLSILKTFDKIPPSSSTPLAV